MTLLEIKLITLLPILATALIGGLIPVLMKDKGHPSELLIYGEHFSHGVFFGVGFLHILPQAMTDYLRVYPDSDYPVVLLICLATVVAILFMEQWIVKINGNRKNSAFSWLTYSLIILLSIHSLVEGGALGLGDSFFPVFIIFLAIISHKGAMAFALAVKMRKVAFSRQKMLFFSVLFSFMAPLGILFGTLLNSYLVDENGILFEAIFGAIAAGTFFTVGLGQHGVHPMCEHDQNTLAQVGCFSLGILLMALAAIAV